MLHPACPTCGFDNLDVSRFDSMMVLSAKVAFFSLRCPKCHASVSTVAPIPVALRDEVQFAAIEVDAGMGEGDRA